MSTKQKAANANTAPINFGQVVETADSVRCQNQWVTLSFWARLGANYSGGQITAQIIYGTGSNQSAASMVGSAWTTQGVVATQPFTLTNAMTRYSLSGVVPVAATQLGVLLTWTPTGTAGSVDGIYLNGFQLEIGANVTPFEREDVMIVIEECQRYCWCIAEPAATIPIAQGNTVASNSESWIITLPVQMYKAPAVTTGVGAFKVNTAASGVVAATSLSGNAVHTPTIIGLTAAGTATAGQAATLQGGGGSGYILASADF